MATEVPVGFTEDGKLVTAFRFSESELADIYMACEMYNASPDGQEQGRRFVEGLQPGSIEISGYFDAP